MEFVDRTLSCMDCSQPFIFTAGEQEFYDRKGFREEPKRCKPCRDARKLRRNDKLTDGVTGMANGSGSHGGNGNHAMTSGDGPEGGDDDIGNRLAPAAPVVRGPRQVREVAPTRAGREMFEAVCAQCGAQTQVPFRPVSGRPVYCRECFGRRGVAGGQP